MEAQEDRRSAMLDLARRWRESGAKARVFAQEHGITAWTLYYWRKRLEREERPARRRRRPRRVTLAPVHVMTAADDHRGDLERSSWPAEIACRCRRVPRWRRCAA
jgi:transposase-like protein